MKILFSLLFTAALVFVAKADILLLQTGHAIYGKIQATDDKGFKFNRSGNTYSYPASSVIMSYAAPFAVTNKTDLPSWGFAIDTLATNSWKSEIKQIPSTVVDKGILKNVPYMSFRCGADYEINIYGDPENPSCIEIGCYRSLIKNNEAQDNCLNFISNLITDSELKNLISKLQRDGEKKQSGSWTIEITPPSADDSYGGWWISIYSESKLESSRATPEEIAKISVAKSEILKSAASPYAWAKNDLTNARQAAITYPAPVTASAVSVTPSTVSSGGSVYVRGYTRKDGTYVQPYTRSRPHK